MYMYRIIINVLKFMHKVGHWLRLTFALTSTYISNFYKRHIKKYVILFIYAQRNEKFLYELSVNKSFKKIKVIQLEQYNLI
jgi:hypothetical protein